MTAESIITSNVVAIFFLPLNIALAGIPLSASGVMPQMSRPLRDFASDTSTHRRATRQVDNA
jgi:hypothetical protein